MNGSLRVDERYFQLWLIKSREVFFDAIINRDIARVVPCDSSYQTNGSLISGFDIFGHRIVAKSGNSFLCASKTVCSGIALK